MLKKFRDLTEREILALAISSEEEDGRIYGEFADALRESYPATADMFEGMREEEVVHRDRLLAMFRTRFGERILVWVHPIPGSRTRIEIESRPRVPATLVDYGTNKRNVERLRRALLAYGGPEN